MNLKEYEQNLTNPLRQATIMLLLREGKVLLAMKKRGFGVGKWNGVGGKPNPGEDIKDAALRETLEEINVTPLDIKQLAELNYYHSHIAEEKNFNQQVLVYIATKWVGEPQETEEMKPQWFKLTEIPFSEMWVDDPIWMPKVLDGVFVKGSFMFGENEQILEYYLNEV